MVGSGGWLLFFSDWETLCRPQAGRGALMKNPHKLFPGT